MVFHNSYYPNTESKSVDLLDRYKKIILNCSNYIITPYMLTFEFIMESSPSIMSWITTKLLFIINLSIYIRNSCLIMRFNGKWNWLRFRASWRNAYFVFFALVVRVSCFLPRKSISAISFSYSCQVLCIIWQDNVFVYVISYNL